MPGKRGSKKPAQSKAKPRSKAPAAETTEALVCGDCGRSWTRPPTRGRKPVRCPECAEKVREDRAPEDAEALRAERQRKANDRIDDLERRLRANGSHIKQDQVRHSYSLVEIDERLTRLEDLVASIKDTVDAWSEAEE